jgi:hypothetical protein
VVWVRRSVILVSRSASCSVVHASAAFYDHIRSMMGEKDGKKVRFTWRAW